MKLSDYFSQQHSQEMPARMKSKLFSRIQKEKLIGTEISVKLPSKIFFFASKKIMYASLAAILVFVVFGGLLLERNDVVDFGIFSVQKHNNGNGVFADYVAEIIEFNGDFSLQRNGLDVPNIQDLKLIEDGDVIKLPEGTDLLFDLTDGTQSKIVGPAEFSITKLEEGYQISLVDGKFFRIYCPECISDIEIVTPDLSIHQDKNQALDVHIAKEENGNMLVKNDGDAIVVKTKKDDSQKETTLTSAELVAINPDADAVDVSGDSDLMSIFMTKNNISATFTLSTEKVEWPTIQPKISDEISEQVQENVEIKEGNVVDIVDDNTNVSVDEEKDLLLEGIIDVIASDLAVSGDIDETVSLELGMGNEGPKVPATDQMQSLKTNLNSFFLMNLFESIYNQDKTDQNIAKFADRVNAISSAFGYSYKASSDLSNIKDTIKSLKSEFEKDWYISPSYILQMEKVINWCDELQNPSKSDWENLKSDLPINLRLM